MENELNKWIVEVLFERCWHEFESMPDNANEKVPICTNCEWFIDPPENPEYTKSLDLASLVEAKAIEKVGKTVYFEHLCYVTQDATWRPEYEKREVAFILSLVTATALQRCTAARAAVEGI